MARSQDIRSLAPAGPNWKVFFRCGQQFARCACQGEGVVGYRQRDKTNCLLQPLQFQWFRIQARNVIKAFLSMRGLSQNGYRWTRPLGLGCESAECEDFGPNRKYKVYIYICIYKYVHNVLLVPGNYLIQSEPKVHPDCRIECSTLSDMSQRWPCIFELSCLSYLILRKIWMWI